MHSSQRSNRYISRRDLPSRDVCRNAAVVGEKVCRYFRNMQLEEKGGRVAASRLTLFALTESKRPIWRSAFPATLRYRDFATEVDVLDCVEEFYSFGHRALERFAAGDEAGAAGALVDDSGSDCFFEVVCTGCAAGVDETGAAHVAIRDLVAAKVDGMIAGEVGVNTFVEFAVAGIAHVEHLIAAIIFGELLFNDVGFDGDAEMIGLAGEVGGEMIVLIFLEGVVAEVAPENGGHAEFVGVSEGLADFDNLAGGLIGAEVDGG